MTFPARVQANMVRRRGSVAATGAERAMSAVAMAPSVAMHLGDG